MDEKLVKLDEMLTLFEYREAITVDLTNKLFKLLEPTVLLALCELFERSMDQIRWTNIESTETTAIITCSVDYNPHNEIPEFIQLIARIPPQPDDVHIVERGIRIGIPLNIIFSPKDDVREYIKSLATRPKPIESGEPESTKTEDVELTEDQLLQMLIFQQQTRGAVH